MNNRNRAAFTNAALLAAMIPAGPMVAGGMGPVAAVGYKPRARQSMTARNKKQLAKHRAMNKIAAKSRKINRRNGK